MPLTISSRKDEATMWLSASPTVQAVSPTSRTHSASAHPPTRFVTCLTSRPYAPALKCSFQWVTTSSPPCRSIPWAASRLRLFQCATPSSCPMGCLVITVWNNLINSNTAPTYPRSHSPASPHLRPSSRPMTYCTCASSWSTPGWATSGSALSVLTRIMCPY